MQIKKRKKNMQLWIHATVCVLCGVIVLVFLAVLLMQSGKQEIRQIPTAMNAIETAAAEAVQTEPSTEAPTSSALLTYPKEDTDMMELTADNLMSESAVLINVQDNTIMAQRDAQKQIYPASMTKIMTLLIAAEQIEDLQDTFTMTYEIIEPLIEADASRAGFEEGETVTMTDLLYGIALPSGADATVAVAQYICGTEEEFVELMNEKAQELGLEHTHFVNTSGLHDPNHYSTVTDIAMLMSYAMQNDVCHEILSTYQYRTSSTEQHPEGIMLESTMYSRMYGDEVEGVSIEGGKTGYTDEAGHCLVSYAEDDEGIPYVAVVAKAPTYWQAIYDTFALYGLIDNGYPLPTDLAVQTSIEPTEWIDESNMQDMQYE